MDPRNPLTDCDGLVPFSAVRPEHVVPAIQRILDDNRHAIAQLLLDAPPYHWQTLITPLETLEERLRLAWGPVTHLKSVCDSPELRAAFSDALPAISAYYTELGQHEGLYHAYRDLAEGEDRDSLTPARARLLELALLDFRLSGIGLPADAKARYQRIAQELASLSQQFSEHVLDATRAFSVHCTDAARLAGLPESALALARQNARQAGLDGWLLTLDLPCYLPVLNHADDRSLRCELYTAYCTRASDQGPHAGQWDNSDVMRQILRLRHELAGLLGFASYAEYSLATKMADTPATIETFLLDLAGRCRAQGEREIAELREFASRQLGLTDLQAWDIGYVGEKLREQRYRITQEELRPYFPEPTVLNGLFALAGRLLGLRFEPRHDLDLWHPQARAFDLCDADGEPLGLLLLDLYARPGKKGGAWMDGLIARRRHPDGLRLPVACLVTNFTPPVDDQPACLTHSEVLTLLHEVGHGLHHLLTEVDHPAVAGIHGVEWDAVELPSQLFEHWGWSSEGLALLSGHVQTGDTLPSHLQQRLLAARHFQAAIQTLRQIEFSLFDLRLHCAADVDVQACLQQVRQEVAVFVPPAFNRFANAFSHIFSGGYAAGYYSYKWAEVLSSDAFGAFEEEGVLHAGTGRRLRREVLACGGSRPAMESFVAFRGRPPTLDALLRHSGIQ